MHHLRRVGCGTPTAAALLVEPSRAGVTKALTCPEGTEAPAMWSTDRQPTDARGLHI